VGRRFARYGHTVRLMAPKFVSPHRNKTANASHRRLVMGRWGRLQTRPRRWSLWQRRVGREGRTRPGATGALL